MSSRSLVDENGRVVCERCEVARTLVQRTVGLLGRDGLGPGEGLFIERTSSIHTWFMRFPMDAVFLDKNMKVKRIVAEMRPFRMAWGRGSKSVLELAAGEAGRAGIEVGRQLAWSGESAASRQ